MATLRAKGLSETFIEIIRDIYTDVQTTIHVNGESSPPIPWRRGVIQGCPLSPLLFNACMDPFLTRLERFNKGHGAVFEHMEEQITLEAQAYADDVVLISHTREGMNALLDTLKEFETLAKIEVAPAKCNTLY